MKLISLSYCQDAVGASLATAYSFQQILNCFKSCLTNNFNTQKHQCKHALSNLKYTLGIQVVVDIRLLQILLCWVMLWPWGARCQLAGKAATPQTLVAISSSKLRWTRTTWLGSLWVRECFSQHSCCRVNAYLEPWSHTQHTLQNF